MDILVNGVKLDYELENEHNLAEVLKSLEKWLLGNGRIISSVSIDRRPVPLDFELEAFQRDISSVGEVSVGASNRVELAMNTLITVGEYIQKIVDEDLGSDSIEHHEVILEGLNLIHEGVCGALRILCVKDIVILSSSGRSLRDALIELKKMAEVYTKKYIEKDDAKKISLLLKEILLLTQKAGIWGVIKHGDQVKDDGGREESFIRVLIADTRLLMQKSIGWCQSIAENLQIGRDIQAYRDIGCLTEVLEEVLGFLLGYFEDRRLKAISGEEPKQSLIGICRELSCRLKKIEESFIMGDMVSVADIVEYEMMPLIQELAELVN